MSLFKTLGKQSNGGVKRLLTVDEEMDDTVLSDTASFESVE
jgi:hypothetical protein